MALDRQSNCTMAAILYPDMTEKLLLEFQLKAKINSFRIDLVMGLMTFRNFIKYWKAWNG